MSNGLFDLIFILVFVLVLISFVTKLFPQIVGNGKMFGSSTRRDLIPGAGFDGSDRARSTNYDCPNCGAALREKIDVSPSGDVKCLYCKKWFNIHQQP